MSIVNSPNQTILARATVALETYSAPPLDETLYSLDPKDAVVFKTFSGISDDQLLKEHILHVQAQAYKVVPYPCIHRFSFLRMEISEVPGYSDMLKLGREREDAILLDVGCCFGTDARRIAFDGFPAKSIVGTDLKAGEPDDKICNVHYHLNPFIEFFELGHDLFRSTPATFPAHFVSGDIFDPSMLSIFPPDAVPDTPTPDLSHLASLNPLQGRVSIIHANKFFHLFNEERQLHLARALAGLLSPIPGSMICGAGVGGYHKGIFTLGRFSEEFTIFCHSLETWIAMWDGEVFKKGSVKVEARLVDYSDNNGMDTPTYKFLMWSVTRL
ncbi:hypothetical protein BJ138DRAFT_551790 [Hygrophoropsis aurantiaca]|uniref:Uncharacterized protein n=1 Tax=Hygrophoropsis aurantiaca TaxID=72124 RepID=A0ACB8A1H3_9AGAM|nr:hypothetical protein BJ138DRAFT_551790 [Hygrophoropsis aurantiaca]